LPTCSKNSLIRKMSLVWNYCRSRDRRDTLRHMGNTFSLCGRGQCSKEWNKVEERLRFVARRFDGENMADWLLRELALRRAAR